MRRSKLTTCSPGRSTLTWLPDSVPSSTALSTLSSTAMLANSSEPSTSAKRIYISLHSSASAAAKPKSNSHASVTMYGKQVSSCTVNTVIIEVNSESKVQTKSFESNKTFNQQVNARIVTGEIKKIEKLRLETHF